uniref:GTD-binding domain-containing protein n=1 Tax=Oryza nivara TaxID=4536 RepID=A0A0E0J3J4_ORYNI
MAELSGDEACPLCGGGGPPARVAMHKRRLPAEGALSVARVGAGDEAAALREAVARQQHGIAELQAELEAERGAAAGAACEAMSMILRLQQEKSEAMMEARQFRRYAEERFSHDAAEVAALRDAVEQRDATVRSLSAQLRACRFRLLHLGFNSPLPSLTSSAAEAHQYNDDDDDEHHPFDEDYPPINCDEQPASSDVGTPRTHHLLNRMPGRASAADKGVISSSSTNLFPDDSGIAMDDEFPLVVDREASDQEDDCHRVYTVDAVHVVPVAEPENPCYFGTPIGGEMSHRGTIGTRAEEEEIQKLSARLQALEADRESMRHAIMSMGSEKQQVVLLKEIAQKLCKEAAPLQVIPFKVRSPPQPVVMAQRKVVKRQSFFAKFFVVAVIKIIAYFIFILIIIVIGAQISYRNSMVPNRFVWEQCWPDAATEQVPQAEAQKVPQKKLAAAFTGRRHTNKGKILRRSYDSLLQMSYFLDIKGSFACESILVVAYVLTPLSMHSLVGLV